ncbi:hypothetical protein FISHEDRAFT_42038 [Fistulina hepatica ATCC 64428]|uniref:Uncharacterized protein n=1 Tax=Fistulina hepatica ATCC 64428 TaxID=1128425 RepID=A0A0D7AEG6_9AGAR|nr:hypothetical protein FISHEDRAFT_42038 [Fistulina hepatica ATCC 64428]
MRLAYPASNQASHLNDFLLAIKIARHSPCSRCEACQGLHPEFGVDVVLDHELSGTALPTDEHNFGYLEMCACGHSMKAHGADDTFMSKEEFSRRAALAIRLDEYFQRAGKLLMFDFKNDDIESLRRELAGTQGMPIFTSITSPSSTDVLLVDVNRS